MKITHFIAFALGLSIRASAQEPADALRYSWLTQNGTARNQAIGGAGVSLGGEFSSLFINPAGLGFYKNDEFVITPGYAFKNLTAAYKGNSDAAGAHNFNLGPSGFLFATTVAGHAVRSVNFGFGLNRLADFNENIHYKGLNSSSSYSEKYLEELVDNNVKDSLLAATGFPFGSSLGFNTGLIETIQGPAGSIAGYRSLANPAFGLMQENTIHSSGGITAFALAGGIDIKDKIYVGTAINFTFLNYDRHSQYQESDASGNVTNNFNYFQSNETLNIKGVGSNLKLGIIYKPIEDARLGLTLQIPTSYQLTDTYSAQVITDLEGYGGAGIKEQRSQDLNDGQALVSKYALNTPLTIAAGASYVFHEVADITKQRGFLTADVEYANYKGNSFKPAEGSDAASQNYYSSLTQTTKATFRNAFNARIGGEIKFNTYMFRLGGAYYGNPYLSQTASLFKISGGLGFRNRGIFVDLAYVYTFQKDINYPYLLQDKPNVPAALGNRAGNIVATIGLKI